MSDLSTNCPDNPYNPQARLARDAERRQRKTEVTQYCSLVAVDRETSKLVARACGVRVIDAPRRESEYVLPVPAPPIHPYHPLENPASTVSKFDDAVKTDRAWMATQRAKFERN